MKLTTCRLLVALVAAGTVLAGCGGDGSGSTGPVGEATFEVNPDLLGPAYENGTLGIAFRPPRGWTIIAPDQRARIADVLLERQQSAEYSLDLVDLFLHDSTSFASLSRVTVEGAPATNPSSYADYYEDALEPNPDDEIRARATFRVDDLVMTQIRYRVADRIVFTVITTAGDGSVIRFDYSIPVDAFAGEGAKLESSIGTLKRLES